MQYRENQKLQPMRGHIFVKCIEHPEKSKGGIILLDRSKPLPTESEVVAIGKPPIIQGKEQPWELKVGDTVLHRDISGHSIKMEDDYYLILNHDQILAVCEKES